MKVDLSETGDVAHVLEPSGKKQEYRRETIRTFAISFREVWIATGMPLEVGGEPSRILRGRASMKDREISVAGLPASGASDIDVVIRPVLLSDLAPGIRTP